VNENGGAATFDGRTWAMPRTGGPLATSSVSCPAPAFCVSVSSDQAVILSSNSWSHPTVIDTPNELTSVSCPSISLCVATDIDGRALALLISTVQINTSNALVRHRLTKIELACNGDTATSVCRGTLSLSASVARRVHRRVRGHRRALTITQTVLIAHTNYAVPSGTRRAIPLRFGRHAILLLTHLHEHRLLAHATATLDGGAPVSHEVTVHLTK
jgi:hypothetical protein